MKARLEFQRNAHVLDSNAREIGSLERVVVDSKTREVTHVVVREGPLFNKKDKVVPIDLVAEATNDQILLVPETGDPDQLTPFEEQQIVDEGGKASNSPTPPRPVIMPGYSSSGMMSPIMPVEPIVIETVRNIPEGTVALKEGAKVLTADEKPIGKVERVVADSAGDRITHMIVSAGMFGRESRMIPVDMVMTIDEGEVRLRVKKDAFE